MKQIEDRSAVDVPVGSEGGRRPSALPTGMATATPTMVPGSVRAQRGRWSQISPLALVRRLWMHRALTIQFGVRSLRGLYGGSFLGLAWMTVRPVLMLVVFTFVFGVVFQSRFFPGQAPVNSVDFGLALFLGLSIFTLLADMIGKSPGLIVANTNFVKRVAFPLDVLVVSEFAAAVMQFLASLSLFAVFMLLRHHGMPAATLSLPVVILPFAALVLGVSFFLAATGVFLRDLPQVANLAITVLMFLSPIFFPLSAMPAAAQAWMFLNPVADVAEQARAAVFLGAWPDPWVLLRQYAVGFTVLWLGWAWFEGTRRGFADVL
ncbi:MAG: ABC transporter permease [Methylocystis sp.]|nr:ABC transporter permease [Acidobacteriaceae bacterium]MCA3475566.1 ABC transporter permease [Rhodobacter sp.]MCA3583533.1 ABC transporter permease [Methylocystis sp.]